MATELVERNQTKETGKAFSEDQIIADNRALFDGRTMKSICFVQYRFKGERMIHTRYFDHVEDAHNFIDAHNVWEVRDAKGNIVRRHSSQWDWMSIQHMWLRRRTAS